MMRLGSLCTGIGGLDLGLALALAALGFRSTIAWQVEHNAYCQEVLAQRFPGADRTVTDVRNAGGRQRPPGVRDFLSAQPARGAGTLPGRKPLSFAAWLFGCLGMQPGDTLDDLYPGTGVISRAWASLSSEYSGDASPGAAHDTLELSA